MNGNPEALMVGIVITTVIGAFFSLGVFLTIGLRGWHSIAEPALRAESWVGVGIVLVMAVQLILLRVLSADIVVRPVIPIGIVLAAFATVTSVVLGGLWSSRFGVWMVGTALIACLSVCLIRGIEYR